MQLDQLNEVAAGVIKDGHRGAADIDRCLREHDACRLKLFHLRFDVIDAESGPRDAVSLKGVLKRALQDSDWALMPIPRRLFLQAKRALATYALRGEFRV